MQKGETGLEVLWSTSQYKKKKKCLVTVSKGKICGHLVAGKNDFFIWNHTLYEQFKELKEYEQKKKTSLKWKQNEAGNYSVVSLCITD